VGGNWAAIPPRLNKATVVGPLVTLLQQSWTSLFDISIRYQQLPVLAVLCVTSTGGELAEMTPQYQRGATLPGFQVGMSWV